MLGAMAGRCPFPSLHTPNIVPQITHHEAAAVCDHVHEFAVCIAVSVNI